MSEGRRLDPEALEGALRAVFADESVRGAIQPIEQIPPSFAAGGERYEVRGELGRGGIGIVYEGRDRDLGRSVALKVLRAEYDADDAVVARFLEEAQIGAQLQHPGVVPVYDLGLADEERLYLSMKLVGGESLAVRLRARPDPAHERRRLLGIFEQVCQTMAYVHARGVIHRDLKPANVMLGDFGEVLIVDWGLAKVRGRPEEGPHRPVATERRPGSVSVTGAVRGTPAYMPPEQARGRAREVDRRSDVFALGAMLCEILTGRPPYTGESTDPLFEALEARLEGAYERLASCGAHPELAELARHCLAPEPADRPADAGEVARAIDAWLAAREAEAREAEVAAAGARARTEAEHTEAQLAERQAAWHRRARRRTLAASAVVLLAVVLGGGGLLWKLREDDAASRRTHSEVTEALREATRHEAAERWEAARAQADLALARARGGRVDPETLARAKAQHARIVEAADAATAARRLAREDADLLARLDAAFTGWQPEPATCSGPGLGGRDAKSRLLDGATRDAMYAAAFRRYGIDVDRLAPEEAAARVRARSDPVRLAAHIEYWSRLRRDNKKLRDKEWRHLAEIARRADPDERRERVREAVRRQDLDEVFALLSDVDVTSLSTPILSSIRALVRKTGAHDAAVEHLLRRAWEARAGSAVLSFELGMHLGLVSLREQEALRHLTAAVAVRPDAHNYCAALGAVLLRQERVDEAAACLRKAIHLDPDYPIAHLHLGDALARQGKLEEAVTSYRRAIELDPESAGAHDNLGVLLMRQGRLDEAVASYRRAIELDLEVANAHSNLGTVLSRQEKHDDAIACWRRAIELDPEHVCALHGLGGTLALQGRHEEGVAASREAVRLDPSHAPAHYSLGLALAEQGKFDEAVTSYRRAIELDPQVAELHNKLGIALKKQGKLDEAASSYRRAIELDPQEAVNHNNLGIFLGEQGRHEEAAASFQRAIELDPDAVCPHHHLGSALEKLGRFSEGVDACLESIRLDPAHAEAYGALARLHRAQGKLDEAVACGRRAIELDPGIAEFHVDLGIGLARQRKPAQAEACFRKAIGLDPKQANPHLNLGATLGNQGRLDEAVACYRKAIELDPSLAPAHFNLGIVLIRQGRLDEAIACLRTSIELKPQGADAHTNLGTALGRQGKHTDAEACYRKAIELDPQSVLAHCNLALTLAARGRLHEALACYHRAIELDPTFAPAHFNLGNALLDLGRLDEAVTCWRKATEVDPKHALAHTNLCNALIVQGRLDEAVVSGRRAIELDPGNVQAHGNLGTALVTQGKFEEAIACFRQAIALEPSAPMMFNALSWILATCADGHLHDADEAVALARRAVELAPGHGSLWSTLGVALYRAGRFEDAIQALERSMELDRGGRPHDWLFFAMACWRLEQPEPARRWYAKAVAWMAEQEGTDEELERFRAEAEALLDGEEDAR